jgi:beta-glucanase (GH16 family)
MAVSAILLSTTTPASAEPPPGADWQLVFSDEFNGKTADLDRNWNFQNGPNSHILCSRWRENAVVTNGLCRLENRKQKRGGQDWTSASLSTKRQFKHGYFECRYRYGAAPGLNNSFWIMTKGGTTNTPGRFEIDINEGHFTNTVNMNIHNWTGKHWAKSKTWHARGHDLSQEFHVYALEWNEQELIWFFDGQEIRREQNTLCHREAPVLLSSAIMKWAGDVTDKIDGTAMEVDFVRIYQLKGQAVDEPGKKTSPGKSVTVP